MANEAKVKETQYDSVKVEAKDDTQMSILCERELPDCYSDIITACRRFKNENENAKKSVGLPITLMIHRLSPEELSERRRKTLKEQGMPREVEQRAMQRALKSGQKVEKVMKSTFEEFIAQEAAIAGIEQDGRKKKLEGLLRKAGLYPDVLVFV